MYGGNQHVHNIHNQALNSYHNAIDSGNFQASRLHDIHNNFHNSRIPLHNSHTSPNFHEFHRWRPSRQPPIAIAIDPAMFGVGSTNSNSNTSDPNAPPAYNSLDATLAPGQPAGPPKALYIQRVNDGTYKVGTEMEPTKIHPVCCYCVQLFVIIGFVAIFVAIFFFINK